MCPKKPLTPKALFSNLHNCPLTRRDLLRGALGAGITAVGLGCSTSDNNTADTDPGTDANTDTGTHNETNTDAHSSTDSNTDYSQTDTGSDTAGNNSIVYVVNTTDRNAGLATLLGMVDMSFAGGKDVVIKPNFNSSNPFPASTHDDTISGVVQALNDAGCGAITLAESCGPSGTESVIADKGTLDLCSNLGIDFLNLDNAEYDTFSFDGMTWPTGSLAVPSIMRSDQAVVLLPCLKTHAWGNFTLSLKIAVGLVPRDRRWSELHPNAAGDRSLIAEINAGYTPDLIVLDGISAFRTGGPDEGDICYPGLLFASTDRVAIDAVGVAVLKMNDAQYVSDTPIFAQEQIARAVELGLGAASPADIELVGNDDQIISDIRAMLDLG